MKQKAALVAGFLLAVFCLTPRLGAQDGKDTIVGGERIGQVRLGMNRDAVEKLLGKPALGDAAMGGKLTDIWVAKSSDGRVEQTEVYTHRDEDGERKVTQIAVTSPFFRTRGGNSTNSDLDAVWREFPALKYAEGDINGQGSDLELYDDAGAGLAFLIERNKRAKKGEPWGKCRAVIVHPKEQQVGRAAVGAPLQQAAGS